MDVVELECEMPDYRKNHFIPRFMIDYWIDPAEPRKGVHVYERQGRRTYVSTGEGKKPYSFAIANDLYVHTATGERAVGLERWFSGLEGALSQLVRQAHVRQNPIVYETVKGQVLALMAILGLECRSPYNLRKIQETLASNASLQTFLYPDPTKTIEQQVLENIIHGVTERVTDLTPTEMVFIVAPETQSWILCDRPYFHDESLGHRFVILTNKVALAFKRSDSGHTYQYIEATDEFFHTLNHQIALQSRDWLVAHTPEALREYAMVLDSAEWANSMAGDTVVYAPIRNLTTGWSIVS